MKYTTQNHKRTRTAVAVIVLAVFLFAAAYLLTTYVRAGAEDVLSTAWVMCRPGEGNYIRVRETPSTKGKEIGRLDSGDWFKTDGENLNGWIRCYGIGESEGWIYCGFVVTEEPQKIMENYICTSNGRVACRRWIGGPQVDGAKWIKNGSTVTVFYIAEDWACTSRGYIRAEYLEPDPE